jgi:hypothetical protein
MKKFYLTVLAATVAISGGCYKADQARMMAWNSGWRVTFYPPGHDPIVYHSNGKPKSEANSDGYYFINKETGKIVEVTSPVVIEQE